MKRSQRAAISDVAAGRARTTPTRRAIPPKTDPSIFMWAEAFAALDRAERMQRQFFRRGPAGAGPSAWEPPVDIFETDLNLFVVVALPGVDGAEVELGIEDGRIVIAGERRLPLGNRAAIRRLEIPHGRFERRIELPAGDYELGERDLVNGCLVLALRKRG